MGNDDSGFQSRWEVFLSFRGEDTRHNFTDCLYNELRRYNILTFLADEELERGEEIAPSLLKAIEASEVSIAVISKSYASSRWCLKELAAIVERGKLILPVFYEVDPSDVRQQKGPFMDDFRNMEQRFGEDEVVRWRNAMEKVGGTSGYDSKNYRDKRLLIQSLVKDVLTKLRNTPLGVAKHPLLEDLMSIFDVKANGMGGKATLAKASYNELVIHIKSSNFISNVRETSRQHNSLTSLQNNLISDRSSSARPPIDDEVYGQIAMEKKNKLLSEVTDSTIKWTVKVKITSMKGPLRSSSKDGKSTYKKLVLTDEKGTQMQATIFHDHIPLFEDILHVDKIYSISRGIIKEVKPVFKILDHDYEMIINGHTRIEEAKDENMEVPQKIHKFLTLHKLQNLTDITSRKDVFAVLAIVLKVSPEQKTKRKRDLQDISFREITIIDTHLKPTILTAWGASVQNECEALSKLVTSNPIIVATNLRLREYNGQKSLSTTLLTDIFIHPDTTEAQQLRSWLVQNAKKLKKRKPALDQQSSYSSEERTTLDEVINYEDIFLFIKTKCADMGKSQYWIKATISSMLPQQKCWYMSCSNCHKKTTKDYDTSFTCEHCYKENVTAKPRCLLHVKLADSSTVLPTTLFGADAEKVLRCQANSLMNLQNEELHNLIETWTKKCSKEEFMFRVKVVKQNSGEKQLRVLSVKEESPESSTLKLLTH